MASSYIDQALLVYSLSKSNLTAYIGSRLYHVRAPKTATRPYGVLTLIEPDNESTILGTQKIGNHLFQAAFYGSAAEIPSKAFLAAQVFLENIRDYSGSMDGITIRHVMNLRGPRETIDPNTEDGVSFIVEFEIEYMEP